MSELANKPVIGVLGGICSGKSTVARLFADLGCAVIDADSIAHELLANTDVKQEVVKLFSGKILDPSGQIDRKKLARIAFENEQNLAALTNIIHPPVLARVHSLTATYDADPNVPAIVIDMPLLLEVGWEKNCDKLVFVDCDDQKRAKRAKKAGFCTDNERKMRENFQISMDTKKTIADNVIDNNSDFSALAGQVADIFSNIVDNK